jgi:hypothetical protein
MPRLRLSVAAIVVAGFVLLSSRASADTVSSLTLTFNTGTNGNGQNGGGAFYWTQTTPVNTAFNTAITTYCLDVQDSIIKQPLTNSFTTHTDLTKAPEIGNKPATVTAINTLYDHFYNTSLSNTTLQAAFQLALWDLVYGSSNPILTNYLSQFPNQFGTGDSATVKADAAAMLNGSMWNGTEHDLANSYLVALVDSSGTTPGTKNRTQDQILVVPNPKGVPAPPALMLAGIGVLALFGRARWTKRATA